MEAEEASMDGSKSAHYLLTANEREYLAKLCWLLNDAGTHALRVTFDNIHPPLVLKEHLAQAHVKIVLNKLYQQKLLTEKQWKILYPVKKRGVSSQKYDSKLLAILLQTICHLCPPYPHGWNALPLGTDNSLSADVVRLSILFQQIGSLGGVRDEEYPVLWKQIGEVLLRLGGPQARIKIQRIDNESVPPDMQGHYIQKIKDIWAPDEKGVVNVDLQSIHRRTKSSSSSKPVQKRGPKKKDDEGLPPEDKHVIMKVYKLLTDTVIAEDIMDRLQQGQIIKISDRQEIMSLGRNQDRMQMILDKVLNSRIPYAFKLLCDALKFKNPKEYEVVMKTRKATYKQGIVETVDLVSVCVEEISSHYKQTLSRCTPLPWLDLLHLSVRDFFIHADVMDSEGKRQHLSDLLPTQHTSGKGTRVVLEGFQGCGQTTLAKMLAFMWASQKNYFSENYEFLVYIDAQTLGEDLLQTVHHQVLPESSKLGVQDFWSLLEANARNVLFLIDGFDETTTNSDLLQIIQGNRFKHSAVLLLVNSDLKTNRYLSADARLFNLGLDLVNISRCLRTYSQLVEMSEEEVDELIELITENDWALLTHLSSPFLCLAALMVFKVCRDKSILDVTTVTGLFELFGEAMARSFCARQNIEVAENEFPEEVLKSVEQLERFAFDATCSKQKSFTDEQLISATQNILITKFGALLRSNMSGRWKLTCSLLTDYLTARYIGNMTMDDISETIFERKLLSRPRFSNMISYLCGLFRNDFDTPTLENIFAELKINNYQLTRALNPSLGKTEQNSETLTSGHLVVYCHSLQGLSESGYREDVIEAVVDSLPNHLIIRRDGMIPHTCISGLRTVLLHPTVNITHVEISLLPVYIHQPDSYFNLAEAMAKSPKLRRLRILWSSLELMAKFLCIATEKNKTLRSIQLEDCTKKVSNNVSAATWSHLQEFCNNVASVKKFIFLNCKMASVVGHILHHLPSSLEEIDFAGCAMNPICAGEVATKIEHSKNLKRLNLSSTRLESSDLKALTQGVKLGESLEELNLGGTHLDRSGVVALAESIRLSNSLKCLDLSNSELTTELCRILSDAIAESRTLNKLIVSHARMTSEGRLYISQAKDSQLQVVGLKTLRYINPV